MNAKDIKNCIKKSVFLFCLMSIFMLLTACGSGVKKDNDKIQIVCTLFPQYDWVREIVGDNDNIEITLLIENGGDLHSYQPTADDIIIISSCDLFIYGGGVSDKWVEDTLKQATNKDMVVINMLETIGDNAKVEELVEGMEAHEHEDGEEEHNHDVTQYDEHIWLSITNAKMVCDKIYENLCVIDGDNKSAYEENYKAYITKLDELDGKYKTMVESAALDTILVADRFPFRYLTSEYNIKYYAAFVGCSADTNASFETITFLSKKLDELKLKNVIVVDGSTQDVAETVIESSVDKNQSIMVLDSIQGVSMERINVGETYLSIMESNYTVLEQVLNNE